MKFKGDVKLINFPAYPQSPTAMIPKTSIEITEMIARVSVTLRSVLTERNSGMNSPLWGKKPERSDTRSELDNIGCSNEEEDRNKQWERAP